MKAFRVEKKWGYTVMSKHHLRNKAPFLKANSLFSQMVSLWKIGTIKSLCDGAEELDSPPAGAKSSVVIYSLLETAKENIWIPMRSGLASPQ